MYTERVKWQTVGKKHPWEEKTRIYDYKSNHKLGAFLIIFLLSSNETGSIQKLRRSRRHRWEPHKYPSNDKKPPWPRMSLYNGSMRLFYRANHFTREVKIVTAVLRFLWESFLTTSHNNNRNNLCFLYYLTKTYSDRRDIPYLPFSTWYTYYNITICLHSFYLQKDLKHFEKFTIYMWN